MRLSKIQKFLKENNINYKYTSSTIENVEFGEIKITDDKTNYTSVSEVTGLRGSKVSGMVASYREDGMLKFTHNTLVSQAEIIKRLEYDIKQKEKAK